MLTLMSPLMSPLPNPTHVTCLHMNTHCVCVALCIPSNSCTTCVTS